MTRKEEEIVRLKGELRTLDRAYKDEQDEKWRLHERVKYWERKTEEVKEAERKKELIRQQKEKEKQEIKERVRIEEEERDKVKSEIQRRRLHEDEFASFLVYKKVS